MAISNRSTPYSTPAEVITRPLRANRTWYSIVSAQESLHRTISNHAVHIVNRFKREREEKGRKRTRSLAWRDCAFLLPSKFDAYRYYLATQQLDHHGTSAPDFPAHV